MFNRTGTNPRGTKRAGTGINNRFVGTTNLIQDDVYDTAGKFLGEIEDIVLDVHSGCVRHAVVALGGFLGIRRKRFAIPWRALTPDVDYRRCVANVAPGQLIAMSIPDDDPLLQRADRDMRHPERAAAASSPRRKAVEQRTAPGHERRSTRPSGNGRLRETQ
jgi:sporulation protein YlmC with PRC-barrel domain